MTTASKKPQNTPKIAGAPVTARIFRNGRSDAVRIPRAMALNCKEVEITRTADGGILIRPKQEISMKEFWAKVDAAKAKIPGGFHMERAEQGEYEVRESLD